MSELDFTSWSLPVLMLHASTVSRTGLLRVFRVIVLSMMLFILLRASIEIVAGSMGDNAFTVLTFGFECDPLLRFGVWFIAAGATAVCL